MAGETHIGLLLAGGQSRRMGGGDKARREFGGRSLIDRAVARLAPQVELIAISANGNAEGLAPAGLPVIEDDAAAGRGPLAGILAGLRWSAAASGRNALLVSVPADTPFVPLDLVRRLTLARQTAGAEIAVAASHDRLHHAVAAWPVALAEPLDAWLASNEGSAVRDFLATRHAVAVAFTAPFDPFFNVNTPDDLERARRIEQEYSP